ncbi:hypothetical protein SKAU_G00217590, partial [Synaphobranchus kaupii]
MGWNERESRQPGSSSAACQSLEAMQACTSPQTMPKFPVLLLNISTQYCKENCKLVHEKKSCC